MKTLIGYDTTKNEFSIDRDVSCLKCSTEHSETGLEIFEGEEWGGEMCDCRYCGSELPVTLVDIS